MNETYHHTHHIEQPTTGKGFMNVAKSTGKYVAPIAGSVATGAALVVGQTLAQIVVTRMYETPEQRMERLHYKEYKRALRAKKRALKKRKAQTVKEAVKKPIDEFEEDLDTIIEKIK